MESILERSLGAGIGLGAGGLEGDAPEPAGATGAPASRVAAVSVVHERYAIPEWGVGALSTDGGVVVAHDFHFGEVPAVAGVLSTSPAVPPVTPAGLLAGRSGFLAGPPEGAAGPPTGTVAVDGARMGNGFVPERPRPPSRRVERVPTELVRRFAAFLAGEAVGFDDVEIDLGWATPFQRAVAETLRGIPRGEVVTYGELAALTGFPGAARAVGTFCATNRLAFIVPCHRVVAASGVGGYGTAGVDTKRRLLALEGVVL
jgi:methylated-DNA-[protein]-cysteine S-methyltransferase